MVTCALSLIFDLEDRFNYTKYVHVCEENNCNPEPIQAFSRIVGTLSVAEIEYPKLSKLEAYQQVQTSEHSISISTGLGDTVQKITHATGLDKLAQLYTQITGKDCGCRSRQEALNKLIPYGVVTK